MRNGGGGRPLNWVVRHHRESVSDISDYLGTCGRPDSSDRRASSRERNRAVWLSTSYRLEISRGLRRSRRRHLQWRRRNSVDISLKWCASDHGAHLSATRRSVALLGNGLRSNCYGRHWI